MSDTSTRLTVVGARQLTPTQRKIVSVLTHVGLIAISLFML